MLWLVITRVTLGYQGNNPLATPPRASKQPRCTSNQATGHHGIAIGVHVQGLHFRWSQIFRGSPWEKKRASSFGLSLKGNPWQNKEKEGATGHLGSCGGGRQRNCRGPCSSLSPRVDLERDNGTIISVLQTPSHGYDLPKSKMRSELPDWNRD